MSAVQMPAWRLAGPLPTDWPITFVDRYTNEADLPLRLSEADMYKAWLVGPAWYVWMGDHYRIFENQEETV